MRFLLSIDVTPKIIIIIIRGHLVLNQVPGAGPHEVLLFTRGMVKNQHPLKSVRLKGVKGAGSSKKV